MLAVWKLLTHIHGENCSDFATHQHFMQTSLNIATKVPPWILETVLKSRYYPQTGYSKRWWKLKPQAVTLGAMLSLCRCHKNAITLRSCQCHYIAVWVAVISTSVIVDAVGQWYLVGLMRTDIHTNFNYADEENKLQSTHNSRELLCKNYLVLFPYAKLRFE